MQPKVKYLYSIASANIMLILMVFIYLLPSALSYSGVSIEIPRVITSESVSGKGYIIIIADDNSVFIGGRRILIPELKSFLSAKNYGASDVFIKADQKSDVGTLAKVWDICRDSGARKVSIATN